MFVCLSVSHWFLAGKQKGSVHCIKTNIGLAKKSVCQFYFERLQVRVKDKVAQCSKQVRIAWETVAYYVGIRSTFLFIVNTLFTFLADHFSQLCI